MHIEVKDSLNGMSGLLTARHERRFILNHTAFPRQTRLDLLYIALELLLQLHKWL